LAALEPYTNDPALRAYAPHYVARADLLRRAGRAAAARSALQAALALELSEPERRLIETRLTKTSSAAG
jgi:RNA polymerase sigma-70 factor (ECF subfamily)